MAENSCSGSGSDAPPSEPARAADVRDERRRGLASIAGGWDGSDELVRILEGSTRTGTREVEDL
jgi:hypothetical protein